MKSAFIHKLTLTSLVAAVYAALTIATAFMSYNNIQFRISEALCILPFFFPFTSWGLFIGCILANLMSPSGALDIIFGSLATLLAALCTALIGRRDRQGFTSCLLACLMPVIFNAFIVGAVIAFSSTPNHVGQALSVFPLFAGTVGLGEAAVMLLIGLPLTRILPKKDFFRKASEAINRYER